MMTVIIVIIIIITLFKCQGFLAEPRALLICETSEQVKCCCFF